jgi:hypothetical protein
MCVSIFCTNIAWNISSLWGELSEVSKICIGLHVKYPLLVSDFNETWTFATDFRKNAEIQYVEIDQQMHWVVYFFYVHDGSYMFR